MAYLIPGELIISVDAAQIAAIVALGIAVIRAREKIARLEALEEARQRHDRP